MGLFDIFGGKKNSSKSVAKDRLRMVLVHDRSNVSPQLLESIKDDMIAVISSYMEIDKRNMEVTLSSKEDKATLIANIPVKNINRRTS